MQNGGVRHFEFVLGNSGPPTNFTYGREVAQKKMVSIKLFTFQDIVILKF